MATVVNPDAGPEEPLRIKLDEEPKAEPAAAAAPAAPTPPAAGIDDLKRQLDESKRQREMLAQANRRAQQERDQAVAVASEAQRRGISADEVVVETRLAAAQQELESLTEAQQAAYEANDWKRVADVNARMTKTGGAIALFEHQQAMLRGQREQFLAMQQQQAAAAQQQRPSDPVEAYIGTRSGPTQQFLRTHRDKIFRSDGSLKRVALDAHEAALDAGHRIDTDGYFRLVEELISKPDMQSAERTRQIKDTSARPKGPPTEAAPVSRGTIGMTGGQSGSEYVMTPHMRELAHEQMGSDTREAELEWFQNYVESVRSGRMEPIQ